MQIFHYFLIQMIPHFQTLHVIQQIGIRIASVVVVDNAVRVIDFDVGIVVGSIVFAVDICVSYVLHYRFGCLDISR